MQLGMIGLGRMGANIVRRLMRAGHACVVFDRDPAPGEALAAEGATAADSLEDLVAKLDAPRAVWVMLPAGGPTESTIDALRGDARQGRRDHRRRQHASGATTSGAARRWRRRGCITSTSAPAAASGGWSAAIA